MCMDGIAWWNGILQEGGDSIWKKKAKAVVVFLCVIYIAVNKERWEPGVEYLRPQKPPIQNFIH